MDNVRIVSDNEMDTEDEMGVLRYTDIKYSEKTVCLGKDWRPPGVVVAYAFLIAITMAVCIAVGLTTDFQ